MTILIFHAPVAYKQDQSFFHNIEHELPSHARVYQLPYIKFPEVAQLGHEGIYAQIKPFLHTTLVTWSFGSMKNRKGDLWQEALDTLPINQQLQILEKNGFAGILIERLAYKDKANSLEKNLKSNGLILKRESPNKEFAFYSFPKKIKQAAEIIPVCRYGEGFYPQESDKKNYWSWSSGDSSLNIYNFDSKARHVLLTFNLFSLLHRNVILNFDHQQLKNIKLEAGRASNIELQIVLKPGITKLKFITDVPAQLPNSLDQRLLAFSLQNLRLNAR